MNKELESIEKVAQLLFNNGTLPLSRAIENQVFDEQKREDLINKSYTTLVGYKNDVYLRVGITKVKNWDPKTVCVEEVVSYLLYWTVPQFQKIINQELDPENNSTKQVKESLKILRKELESLF